jgi:uncharacterized membrane protein YozB (DUF420 family)
MHTHHSSPVVVAERRVFAAIAWTAVAVVVAGFASSYYLWPFTRATHFPAGQPMSRSLPLVVHAHAVTFSLWLALLAVQSGLIVGGDVRTHQRLGRVAGALLPVMLVTGLATAVAGGRAGWNPGGPYRDALSFMFVGLADLTVFFLLTIAGLACRRRADLHRRLMLLGTVGGLLWPAITRMPFLAGHPPRMFGLLTVLVLAPAGHDLLTRARLRWMSLSLGLAVLATFPMRVAIANSASWRSVAMWLIE